MNDYPWIRKWGLLMGSHDPYIESQVLLARQENAPENAIYRRTAPHTGWATTDDVSLATTRYQLGLPQLAEGPVT